VEKALNYFEEIRKNETLIEEQAIYVKSDYKLLRIALDNILFVEGLKDYVAIHVDDKEEPIPSLINMKRIMDYLPSPAFMRVHRSYIVNMKKIESVDRNRIVIGNQFIPISESYKEEVYGYLNKHTVL
jgi:DNA-binding LytR/AlgR family response regulator